VATNANQLAKSGKFGDLRRRLTFLLLALVVYRVGAHIPVPGIDPDQLRQLFNSQAGGILSLFNMFSGGALSRFTVFALGIMPYISASIIMQLMTYVVPTLESSRLRLRTYRSSDAEAMFRLYSAPRVLPYWSFPPWAVARGGQEGRPIGRRQEHPVHALRHAGSRAVPGARDRHGARGLAGSRDLPGLRLPHDGGRQPGGRHDVPDVAG